jgi:hypothetical protein
VCDILAPARTALLGAAQAGCRVFAPARVI